MKLSQHKRAWLAGLLNFVLPGAGYLYLGVRKVFATILISTTVLSIIAVFMNQAKHSSSIVGQILPSDPRCLRV